MICRSIPLIIAGLAALLLNIEAQDAVPLITPKDPAAGWRFNNGQEFRGATGGLTVDPEAEREGKPSLKIHGDFTNGGRYVDGGRKIDNVDIRELSMWVRNPDGNSFTLRINDASGQTHQIALKTEPGPDWQRIVLPLERFFTRRGQADAVTGIAKYESWGGAKDGAWHGPATAIYFVVGNTDATKTRTLWLNDIVIQPPLKAKAGAEIKLTIALNEITEGTHDWGFSLGQEFPGAKGSLTIEKDQPSASQSCFKLAGDFTAGGAYVAAVKHLKDLDLKDVTAIRMKVKTDNASVIGVQLVDGSGQTHQQSRTKIIADGQWHDLILKPNEVAGGEHWGGANDGKWHGPPTQIALSVGAKADAKLVPVVYLADIQAEVLQPVFIQPAAFKSDFETPPLPSTWTLAGAVAIDPKTGFKSGASLALSRTVDEAEKPCSVTSPAFAVSPGQWDITLATKSELTSPDSSYNAVVQLECLDGAGKVTDHFTIADVFGKHDWQPVSKQVAIPKGTVSARFQTQLNKSWGSFWIDDLAAAFLAPAVQKDDRIVRVLFSTAQLGNLLFPNDSREVGITVETRKPLRDNQHSVSCVVRDYWGAEQMRAVEVTLGAAKKEKDRIVYDATLDLSKVSLEVGRYYEVYAAVPQEGQEAFENYTSLAILPEAPTRQFKPEEVPFTSRNWDNRFPEYVKLSDRLGIRICGIWGGWSAKAPYKAEAPTLDLVAKLGMGWLSNTPCAEIERGKGTHDETALRQGVRNLIETFGKTRPMFINLGNEPHGTGQRVLDNVAAYRAVYEEIKKVDPSLTVVATSVEPNEEYFKAGYGKWCDAFDFHIYETSADVRRTMVKYRELMKQYDVVKPLWSTELGLNSQGMTRHVVAVELIKKFTSFFAEGGASVSWFGLLYPDSDGKSFGSSGDSHNVFDCRYNRYCPRLDAVAYYNGVNAISIKKFTDEKQHPNGVHAFLFRDRDGHSLQVLWKDKGRADVSVPLTDVEKVDVIRIDGSHRALNAGGKALTLTISEDPLLLLYDGGEAKLPEVLGAPVMTLDTPPMKVNRAVSTTLSIALNGALEKEVKLIAPPFWTVHNEGLTGNSVCFTMTPAQNSAVREADFVVTLGDGNGELYWRVPVAQ